MLPRALAADVESALAVAIVSAGPVPGGCINNGTRLETDDGRTHFLKWNRSAPHEMFEAEADGLAALRSTHALRIPEHTALGVDNEGTAWLLLEFIEQGVPRAEYPTLLGQGLARLHSASPGLQPGWTHDNWIGSLEQPNTPCGEWGRFWSDRRLRPQLERARSRGFFTGDIVDRVLEVTPQALADVEAVALIHGDLWSGNVFPDSEGLPVLIDPAVYNGHGEVDLAMSELFGGFGRHFYDAYADVIPISSAYEAYRRDLYQLYYLLVHVNLFGASYEPGSLAAGQRVLAALT